MAVTVPVRPYQGLGGAQPASLSHGNRQEGNGALRPPALKTENRGGGLSRWAFSFSYVRAISDEANKHAIQPFIPKKTLIIRVIAATCRPSSARPICIRSAHRHAPPSCTTQIGATGLKARRSQRGWRHRHSSIRLATSAVHPVWWLAPMPAPLSPWKYS